MNGYAILMLLGFGTLLIFGLGLEPEIKQLAQRLADIPQIDTSKTDSPALLQFGIRLAYLVVAIAALKLLITGRNRGRGDD